MDDPTTNNYGRQLAHVQRERDSALGELKALKDAMRIQADIELQRAINSERLMAHLLPQLRAALEMPGATMAELCAEASCLRKIVAAVRRAVKP